MSEDPIYVLDKKLKLLQPEGGFRTSLDSVILAAACPAKPGETVLDLGCGVGSAGLCLLYRVQETALIGVDIQNDSIKLAEKNAALNNMAARAVFTEHDIRTYREKSAHHVVCNPPFLESGTHLISPDEKLARARGHQDRDTTLQNWIDAGFHNLKPLGSLTMIHRADHTDKIIQALGKRFGATDIIPLWPKTGVEAKRVIIRTWKNRKTPARLHPGIVLHNRDGAYTAAADEILRDAAGLI